MQGVYAGSSDFHGLRNTDKGNDRSDKYKADIAYNTVKTIAVHPQPPAASSPSSPANTGKHSSMSIPPHLSAHGAPPTTSLPPT